LAATKVRQGMEWAKSDFTWSGMKYNPIGGVAYTASLDPLTGF